MEQTNNLEAVVDGLFSGKVTTFTASNGVEVIFKRAGIKQLGQITKFINLLVERVSPEKIKEFIDIVAEEQTKQLEAGRSVHDINLNTSDILVKALDKHSLLLTIFGTMADSVGEFVSIFTNMSEAQYNDDLSLDEQIVIASGIFVVNYGFFTQSLPQIIKSATSGFLTLNAKSKGKQGQAAAK